ncbi:MAG TPA: hypothetical protein V6C91_05435 [Coleofasciculaceae cyanobacterium]
MFTPDQITTAIAVNAIADPNSVFGQFLSLVAKLNVDAHDLMVEEADFAAQMEKMLRQAIFADEVVSEAEGEVIAFFDKLKSDQAMQDAMGADLRKMVKGLK